ncbi:PIG-L family deacetylase [Algoriphagus sp. CAU 1675]|uniref:PIG-L deacetylase family protein n=1 Tax=Algoriphagus sp. CAU 1675 TaxID=3032597 RepID=UPI0023DB414C|nr:PIG-L family deacetylase [Algoriphagus sp. CAU 1675]MDF2158373.1 PIG-L family deacetylase [Algoriphagus sp. CAU 1675]
MTNKSSRRSFIQKASALGLSALPLSALAGTEPVQKKERLKVVCVGGHPDDPESGCGGTLAKFSAAGHDVKVLYLTKGEGGIPGKTANQAAKIRTKEAEEACKVLKVRHEFLGQIDGETMVNNEWIQKMTEFMEQEKPDLVFTQWPIDTHRDHQAASILTIQASLRVKKKFQIYFYEVCAGSQTMTFHPGEYVDISNEQETKRKALFCHVSQDPEGIYACGHEAMEKFRGMEAGVQAAEAFVKLNGRNNPSGIL